MMEHLGMTANIHDDVGLVPFQEMCGMSGRSGSRDGGVL